MDRVIRGVTGIFGGGSDASGADAETGAPGETTTDGLTTEPAWTPPATRDELERLVQSETDRRQAKWQREAQQRDASARTQAEWQRIKQLADNGDTWALGEIAQDEVARRAADEEREAVYTAVQREHVPIWDRTFLDPLLGALPADVWKPIVGEGLTTLEDRAQAVTKAIGAHRERAVADALTDAPFVAKLLQSHAFRAAWQKSPVVREQYLAHLRGDAGYEEADAAPGVAVGRSDIDSRLRGLFGVAS